MEGSIFCTIHVYAYKYACLDLVHTQQNSGVDVHKFSKLKKSIEVFFFQMELDITNKICSILNFTIIIMYVA